MDIYEILHAYIIQKVEAKAGRVKSMGQENFGLKNKWKFRCNRKFAVFNETPQPKLRKMVGFWFGYIFSFGTVAIKEEGGGESKDEITKENAGKDHVP